jgi:hypothetical protein
MSHGQSIVASFILITASCRCFARCDVFSVKGDVNFLCVREYPDAPGQLPQYLPTVSFPQIIPVRLYQVVYAVDFTGYICRVPVLVFLPAVAVVILTETYRNTVRFRNQVSDKAELVMSLPKFREPVLRVFIPAGDMVSVKPPFHQNNVVVSQRTQGKGHTDFSRFF